LISEIFLFISEILQKIFKGLNTLTCIHTNIDMANAFIIDHCLGVIGNVIYKIEMLFFDAVIDINIQIVAFSGSHVVPPIADLEVEGLN